MSMALTPTYTPQQVDISPSQWALKAVEEATGGTHMGHHYLQEFNRNKWTWYLRHVRGYVPIYTPRALLFGWVVHSALEYAHVAKDGHLHVGEVCLELLKQRQADYEDTQAYLDDTERGPAMLRMWVNTFWEDDRAHTEVIEVEAPHEVVLGSGHTVTFRCDRVYRDLRTGGLFIADYKTTSYSAAKMAESVGLQDQATMYIMGLSKLYPTERIVGVVPEVLYKRQSVCTATRSVVVTRGPNALVEYEQELIGLLIDIERRLADLAAGWPPHVLFPRNGADEAYFGNSPYAPIYRVQLPDDMTWVPPGYKLSQPKEHNDASVT